MAAYSPAVQNAMDGLALKVVAQLERRFDELVKEGKIGELELRDILGEFNAIARSMKRPASSLQMIAMQPQPLPVAEARSMERTGLSKAKIKELREGQRQALKKLGQEDFGA